MRILSIVIPLITIPWLTQGSQTSIRKVQKDNDTDNVVSPFDDHLDLRWKDGAAINDDAYMHFATNHGTAYHFKETNQENAFHHEKYGPKLRLTRVVPEESAKTARRPNSIVSVDYKDIDSSDDVSVGLGWSGQHRQEIDYLGDSLLWTRKKYGQDLGSTSETISGLHSSSIEVTKIDREVSEATERELSPLLLTNKVMDQEPSPVNAIRKVDQELLFVPKDIDSETSMDPTDINRQLSPMDCASECSTYSRPVISDREFKTLVKDCISGTNCPYSNVPWNCWNISAVTDMEDTFRLQIEFNEPLHCWDTAKVTSMASAFRVNMDFNQPIGSWNTERVTDMSFLFYDAHYFNQPIGSWNIGNVVTMRYAFGYAYNFNHPIHNWNVSKVTNMDWMFHAAEKFNQCLDTWPVKVNSTVSLNNMLSDTQCPAGGTPSLNASTWCQDASNGCHGLLPATTPFTNWTVVSAENKAAEGVSVEPFSVKTFIETRGGDLSYEIFTGHKPGKPCDFSSTPMVEDYSATIVLLDALSDREVYSVQWSIPKVTETPAYNSATQTVSLCARVGKSAEYDSSSPGTDFVSFVDTEVSVQLDRTGSFAQNVTIVPIGNDNYKDTLEGIIDVESLICAPGRRAVSTYQIGNEFGVCVRPTQKFITQGYSVKGFTKVVCSNAASNRTLFNNSVPDSLTSLINASNAGDIHGSKVGSEAAGFVSFVTARYFGDGEKSFTCTGEVTLDYQRRRLSQPFTLSGNDIGVERLLQEGGSSSPFSSTIVLATETAVTLSAGASLVGGMGAVLLSVVVAII